jgi:signal transduction histidine kinase
MSTRILVVDDDPAGRYVKGRILRKSGHDVIEVGTGGDALANVAAAPPDLVLVDVRLPDMSGLDVCRAIKHEHPEILVLQTSAAFTGSRDRAAGLQGGADAYLIEPAEPGEIVAAVTALLRLRKAEQELRQANEELQQRVAGRMEELATTRERLRVETVHRQKVEEALQQAQKMEVVGQLTGGIAHDFNNLLTVVSANLELIEDALGREQPDHAKILKLTRAARRATQRGEELTRQLLAFARRQVLRAEVVDLNQLIADFTPFIRQAAGDTVAVETVLAPALWTCHLDAGQFETALLNLAVNARDAMPSGGTLRIETANIPRDVSELGGKEGLLVSVADSGIGMDAATLEHAFEPFYTTKDVGKGSGLGLSQVYGFIKQSGGHVRLESRPGAGTTISLYLPRHDAATAASVSRGDETALRGGGETVLIVEDNAEVAEATCELIAALGYRTLYAADAETALKLLNSETHIDLVFSDVVLRGGMSGVDLGRETRRRRPVSRVLLTSGYAPDRPGGVEPGEFPLLPKPYRRAELAKRLRLVLEAPSSQEPRR